MFWLRRVKTPVGNHFGIIRHGLESRKEEQMLSQRQLQLGGLIDPDNRDLVALVKKPMNQSFIYTNRVKEGGGIHFFLIYVTILPSYHH